MDGMIGFYSNEHASAEVVKPKCLPAGMDGVSELVRVWCDIAQRKNGYATELVKGICDKADETGTVLMLTPKAFGCAGITDLPAWYERFAFVTIQKDNLHIMARMPQIYKLSMNPIADAATEVMRG